MDNSLLGQKSPWTKVSLDNCLLGQLSPWTNVSSDNSLPWTIVSLYKSLLGQKSPWTIAPLTIVPTPPICVDKYFICYHMLFYSQLKRKCCFSFYFFHIFINVFPPSFNPNPNLNYNQNVWSYLFPTPRYLNFRGRGGHILSYKTEVFSPQ